ncbi:exonuclease SbcCD subunit D [Oscillospiraceae bacterium PP1C4]
MKILHTSDWHLGIALHNVFLLEEQKEMVNTLVETVKREQINAVVIAGDVFDHAVARPDAIGIYNDAVTSLCNECGVPVLICAGNHDGAARLAACSALLRSAGLYIVGKLTDPTQPVLIGDAAFFLLPYFNAEEVRCLYPDASIKSYSDAMGVLIEQMRRRFDPDRRNILVAHCFAGGAEVSESDRAAMVGGSNQVSVEVFEGFDYVALGHLHRAQQIGGSIRYSGSPIRYSFGEAGHQKSFTILDTTSMKISEIPVTTGRELRVLSGEFDALLTAAQFDPKREDYLKIELTDCWAGLEKLELLRECYPNLLLLTGKNAAVDDKSTSLTVDELSRLEPLDIVKHFYLDITGEEPDDELLGWFEQAVAEVDKEVAQ